jgi:monoamine oxidase
MRELEADVCVVGAGYAGLTAATHLRRNGQTVIVLEARDRVGGRIWTERLEDGTPIDRGGAWLGPKHDAAFELTRDVGVNTYKTYVAGKHLLVGEGRTRSYTGLIPKISPVAVLSIALNQLRVDRLSRRIPLEAPWSAKRAQEWDVMTTGSWVKRARIRSAIGHDLFEMAVRGLMTGDLEDSSFLHLLFLVRAHGSINTLFSIENGSQENLIEGGAGSMAGLMADALGDALHRSTPVRSISQGDDHVKVLAEGTTASVRHVVVTVPPALALEIAFDPVLPEDRVRLYRNAIGGPETKTLVVYDEPFWRHEGFSGQSAEPNSVSEVTIDASPAAGTPGVLASFTFGRVAEQVDALAPDERRAAVLGALAARFGPRARAPLAYVETPWFHEEWTRGCSMAHFRPGVLSTVGHLLREPFGRIHWAGTETSTTSHGAIDGAIRSGVRAASEILDRS